MNRKEFIKNLGLGSGGLILPRELFKSAPVIMYDNYVRGLPHYSYEKVKAELREGAQLTLHREGGNLYDSFAVEVHWNEHKLGYLAAYENICIANLLDAGASLHVHISFVDTKAPPYQACGIQVAVDLIKPTSKLIKQLDDRRADDRVDLYRRDEWG